MIKIAYLHGLDANNLGSKNDWLKTFAKVYDPQINYRDKNIYLKLKIEVVDFRPDLIIGSSMGGYFAYKMAKELNIKAILFNPALHSRSMEPDVSGSFDGEFRPTISVVFGAKDNLIHPKKTIIILENEGFESSDFTILEHGHDTPFDVFKSEISQFIISNHL